MTPGKIMGIWSLGGLGVFFVLALLPWVALTMMTFFRDFSALILAFLAGTLWLPAARDAEKRDTRAILLAMGVFCVAWASMFIPAWLGILLLMLCYPLVWWPERLWYGAEQSADYRNLRTLLTWGVVAAHVLTLAALSKGGF